jgi:hypothetical protein
VLFAGVFVAGCIIFPLLYGLSEGIIDFEDNAIELALIFENLAGVFAIYANGVISERLRRKS